MTSPEAFKQADVNLHTNNFFREADTQPLGEQREKDWQGDHGSNKEENGQ
jgi:hypothetical protein